jgi:uncharacterized membrane protein YkvA (DUF1232 family)
MVNQIMPKPHQINLIWYILGGIAVLYLINPTAGIIELIPDNIPLIGNLDEVGATLLLIKVYHEISGN